MCAKFIGSSLPIFRGCLSSSFGTEFRITTVPLLRNTQFYHRELSIAVMEMNFVNVFCNGATDVAIKEKEVMFLRSVHEGVSTVRFLAITNTLRPTAQSNYEEVVQALGDAEMSDAAQKHKLAGFSTDGAVVMQRFISIGTHTHGIFNSRRPTIASLSAHDTLFNHRCLKSPYLTQSATFFSEVDISKIPKDDPEKGKLVYVGTMSKLVKFTKAFSVSTSIAGVSVQPYLYQHANDLPLALTMAVGGMLSFFIFLTPVILHFVTKRYVTKLYYDEDTGKFTATTYTFFVREKDTKFGASNVTFPEVPGLFTTVNVRGRPLFLDPNLFLEKKAYVRLMGYDKPMEWELPDYSEDKKN